jgi:hypothetical protein
MLSTLYNIMVVDSCWVFYPDVFPFPSFSLPVINRMLFGVRDAVC